MSLTKQTTKGGITNLLVGIDKLSPSISGQHVDDDDLTPLLNIHQQITQLAVVLMDEVIPLWTDLLKGLNGTPSHKLQNH